MRLHALRYRVPVALITLFMLGIFFVPTAQAATTTLYVAPSGSGGGSCSTPDYNTIQAAVTAASPGDTIVVCPGTYSEQVTIDKGVTIRSETGAYQTGGVVLTGPGPIFDLYDAASPSAGVTGVTIEGLSFENVTGTGYNGVITVPGNGAGDVTIENNLFENVTESAVGYHGNMGLASPLGTGWTISDNVIDGVTEANNGIGQYAIWTGNLTDSTISNNTISNVTRGGILVDGGQYDQVSGNTVTCFPVYGINVSTDYLSNPVVDVSVTGNTSIGAGSCTYTGVTANPAGILVGNATAVTDVTVAYNDLAGNARAGLINAASNTVDATNNWWGCSTGPGTAGCSGVINTMTTGSATFAPWLVDHITIPSAPVPINSTITGTVDLTYNSAGGQPGGTVPDGTTVVFSSTPAGMAGSGTTTNGTATVSITTGSSANVYSVCAQVPGTYGASEGCTSVPVYDPTGGFVTGGGWINSPPGALGERSDGTVIVSPATMQGWSFFDDNGNGGTGQMVTGPATPPLGTGSAELAVSASNQGYALGTGAYAGTPLADITDLSYWSYQPGPTLAIALQFGIHYTTSATTWQGRLVYEPYLNSNGPVGSGWQQWSPLDGIWWASNQTASGGRCSMSSPCSWSQVLTDWPDASINGATLFKAGSGWSNFDGNVDAFTIGISGTNTTYDFEPTGGPTGKASFAFVSKYLKGASVPTGNTEFIFKDANLDFSSTSYQWLVVNQGGTNAQFKGTGTINGTSSYNFMVWASEATSSSPATFRIKITDQSGNVVYDNGMNQPIGGGSIIVHT